MCSASNFQVSRVSEEAGDFRGGFAPVSAILAPQLRRKMGLTLYGNFASQPLISDNLFLLSCPSVGGISPVTKLIVIWLSIFSEIFILLYFASIKE